jgi:predicted kinase
MDTEPYSDSLSALRQWNSTVHIRLKDVLDNRKKDGFIRECHGDMHLRNMVLIDGKPMAFDCIEFNPQLRWIDVMSEVSFLMMDLQDRRQHILANRFINTYLEATGDYEGLSTLSLYLCYRAMVRAKVCSLRLEQGDLTGTEKDETLHEFDTYVKLASSYTEKRRPALVIMRGLSASGKSTVSQQLVDATGAIRIRSDIERKRLFNISQADHIHTDVDTGIYSKESSQLTYARLAELAEHILRSDFSVIVDATFLNHEQRRVFQILADRLNVTFTIIEVTAPEEVLRRRINERKNDVSDADRSVLEHQLASYKPLVESELPSSMIVDTTEKIDIGRLSNIILAGSAG